MNHSEVLNESKEMSEMPKYRCHKEVHALKIVDIDAERGSLEFELPFNSIQPPPSWFEKHSPEAGGYYVVYADGYASYSPAKAFEDGYAAAKPDFAPSKSLKDLQNRYCYHAPKGNQAKRYEAVRDGCLSLAQRIAELTPESREQTRALNSLDEVMFLANAAIARNE